MCASPIEDLREKLQALAPVKGMRRPASADNWAKVARDVKCTLNTVKNFANGRTPQSDLLFRLFERFGIDPRGEPAVEKRSKIREAGKGVTYQRRGEGLPHAGSVCAGPGTQVNETVFRGQYERRAPVFDESFWMRGAAEDRLFVLDVIGDSMSPMFQDGDLVVVEYATARESLRDREYVVVETPTDGLVLREWIAVTGTLDAINRAYAPQKWPAHARLRGVVKGLVRRV